MRLLVEGLFVKVSGVTTEEDALLSIGLGANAVGFDFAPTPRRVEAEVVRDIIHRLPGGTITVGTFRNEMPQRIVEVANRLGLHAVQLDGRMTLDEVRYVSERVNTVIRALAPSDLEVADAVTPYVDYFLVPEDDDRLALADSLKLFGADSLARPVIASGGLSAANVVDVVQNYPVWGVDARSDTESEPAAKDPVRLAEFIANARWAHANAYVGRPSRD